MNGLAKRASSAVLPLALAFAVVVGLLLLAGANPFKALGDIWSGSMGNTSQVGDTLMAWVPITLATAGFVVTYAAGLWNIGIEGQIAMGGIVATWVGRTMPGPRPVLITLMFLGGAVGGVVWALLAGLLKTKGGVNEIFGGLGLDFVASGLAVYLIIGPWKRAGIASTSGTKLLPASATLPVLGHTRFSLIAAAVAVAGVTSVWLLLRGTRFGLRLKAVGRNPRSAFLMGISPDRYMLGAFSVCGVLAGVAGAVQVSGVWHKLVPSISGGYGFLAILVALLAAFKAARIAPIALFFAIASVGSTQLTLKLNLNSALGGVLQAVVVLFVILGGGWQARRASRHHSVPPPTAASPPGPQPVEVVPPEPVAVER
ncbi:MAG TPA: ABC transporter permease [Acidimicrobiales bacterium]|nr:ABC transporter permease [Acidimicrobiales bacterium]